MAKPTFLGRYAGWILVGAALLTPLACWGALKAVQSNRNDVSDWLPADYPETKQLRWFRRHFVADQFVLMSWEGCTLGDDPSGAEDDPRIAKLMTALLKQRLPRLKGDGDFQCFKNVTSGRTVLNELTSPPTDLPRREAVERLTGALVGPDGRQTCVVATLSDEASHSLRRVVARPTRRFGIRRAVETPLFQALREAGIKDDEVRLGGPPIDNQAIDEEGEKTLVRLAGLAALLGIGLAYWSLRSIRMTFTVFACGVLSAALSLAIVPLTGGSMDAVLMSMPALVYVLAVSGAVHIINYYRQAVYDHGMENAVEHAVAHAWRPAFLCSCTTGIGLASLLTSDIVPIAKFGGYSAVGMFTMLLVLFGVLPAALKKWPWVPPDLRHATAKKKRHTDDPEPTVHHGKGWNRFGGFIRQHHAAVLTVCMLVIAGLCLGLPRVHTSIDLLKLFHEDAKLLQDYRWFEENQGRIVPMEFVIRFPKEVRQEDAPPGLAPGQLVERLSFLERLELVSRVEKSLARRLGPEGDDLVGSTMSAGTFAPNVGGEGSGTAAGSRRWVETKQLSEHREGFERAGFLRQDPENDDELWRVSVRVAAFHGLDHGVLVTRMQQAVEPVLAAYDASVRALEALAAGQHGSPSGTNVIYWMPETAEKQADDIGPFLASKNVGAGRFKTPIDSLDGEEFERIAGELKKSDGVVLGPGFDAGDIQRLRKADVPILATLADSEHTAKGHAHKLGNVDVVYTGVIPVVYKAQHELLNSLIRSTWWSFATITPLMMWVCRGVAAGAVVMLPNALPVLVVFGGMGWLGIPVDIGSMMAASIALGVAVDDTIHFLAWFRDDFVQLGDRAAAVLSAYRRSATATLQAALINGLGLSVFATSSFTPTQRFGWLMLTILVAGVVAELIMCPALLFGPLGRVFVVKTPPQKQAAHPGHERLDNGEAEVDEPHVAKEHAAHGRASRKS